MRKLSVLLATLLVVMSAPVHAQAADWVTQLLAAAQLPTVTAQLRQQGVSNADIVAVLDAMRNAGIPARDAVAVFDAERVARRDNGPVDNFGAFVQSQLAAGKRGTDLAAAIHAEHARQGKGKPGGGVRSPGASPGERGVGRGIDAGRGSGRGTNGKPPATKGGQDTKPGNRGRGRPPNR
jgi:hypothetical protein